MKCNPYRFVEGVEQEGYRGASHGGGEVHWASHRCVFHGGLWGLMS